MTEERWLGIDFSGNHLMWRQGCTTSNVWIADLRRRQGGLHLDDLRRVQQLPGAGSPFARLAALLRSGDYLAAGIDAPFSVPSAFVPAAGHLALLGVVGAASPPGRPFPSGDAFVRLVAGRPAPLTPPKPLRVVEDSWVRRGVPTRSTLWVNPRGGAPMTSACMTLLHLAQRTIWPWQTAAGGLLVEAFPAAQLRSWALPYDQYNQSTDATAVANRARIVQSLTSRVNLGRWRATSLASADALDAVLCAFAALGVTGATSTSTTNAPGPSAATEGWIAIHP